MASTVKNLSLKVLSRETGNFEEWLSYENLPGQVSGVVLDEFLDRAYVVGDGF